METVRRDVDVRDEYNRSRAEVRSWNWMDTDKVALSVVEKNSLLSREELDLVEQIAVIHVRIFLSSLELAIIEYF
jgi:hypothetical protein